MDLTAIKRRHALLGLAVVGVTGLAAAGVVTLTTSSSVPASTVANSAQAVSAANASAASKKAGLLWSGDPSKGTSVFGLLNCDPPGSITVVQDKTKGKVWKYAKPAGDKRCESHGIAVNGAKYNFQNNSTYYIGWWSKLTSTVNDNANFQWKSYGQGMTQNYPFVISVLNGRASVFQRQPGSHGSTVWSSAKPLTVGTWNHFVVGIHTSDQLRGGWIQLWFNGKPQRFVDGTTSYRCRTWDVVNDPKWGVYGAQTTDFNNFVADPKVGFTFSSVAN